MSLINEALKKAQGQQQGQKGTVPPGPPVSPAEPQHPHRGGKSHRRSFLWGFIMAVLVVGIFTTLLTTFFVYQFLGEEEKAESPGESSRETVVEHEDASPEPILEDSEIPGVGELAAAKEPIQDQPTEVSPEKETEKSTAATPPVEEAPAKSAAVAETTPKAPPQPPNPKVVSRLLELEIRGTLGGSKVLILDQATGRTRAYRIGDTLEGSMGLVVEQIQSSSVKFKDYAGFIHTKSF